MAVALDISGLDKTILLLALYDNACALGPAYAQVPPNVAFNGKTGTCELAARAIIGSIQANSAYKFTYCDLGQGPRQLNIEISGKQFDSRWYDYLHGKEQGAKVVATLRKALADVAQDCKPYIVVDDEKQVLEAQQKLAQPVFIIHSLNLAKIAGDELRKAPKPG